MMRVVCLGKAQFAKPSFAKRKDSVLYSGGREVVLVLVSCKVGRGRKGVVRLQTMRTKIRAVGEPAGGVVLGRGGGDHGVLAKVAGLRGHVMGTDEHRH